MNNHLSLALSMVLALLVGCEVPELDIPETEQDRLAKQTREQEKKELDEAGLKEFEAPPKLAEQKQENADGNEPVTNETREFKVQDAKKGKKSRQAGGYLGAVGNARFSIEHKAILANMEKALDLFNAEKGYYPKTQEEFLEKIIKPNKIQLPELEADEEYVYNPEDPKKLGIRKKQ